MAERQHSEIARKIVHMAMGVFATLLRYLTWWQAAMLAGAAVAFNLFLLPRLGTRLYRVDEPTRGVPTGIVFYPIAVLSLVLVFPNRLDIAAAAWGILAFGDGMATIVGRRLGGPRVPWNREKTIAGSAALFVFGGAAGAALAWWCRPVVTPPAYEWFPIGAPFVAALVAACVETIPVRLNDNLSVPAAAAAVLWCLSLVSEDLVWAALSAATHKIVPAVTANMLAAWAGHRAGTVSSSGAVAGAVIGTVIAVSAGWRGWALLVLTFLAAAITSRLGVRRKTLLGIAEARAGRRGAANAIANTGLAATAAAMSVLTDAQQAALIAFAAALTAGGSDTMASELGKAWGRKAYLVPTFHEVPAGTSGAMSMEGTLAGLAGALALAGAAVWLELIPAGAWAAVVIASTLGSFVESLLGATLEGPGILNNDLLNFFNTAVGALAAVLIAGAMA